MACGSSVLVTLLWVYISTPPSLSVRRVIPLPTCQRNSSNQFRLQSAGCSSNDVREDQGRKPHRRDGWLVVFFLLFPFQQPTLPSHRLILSSQIGWSFAFLLIFPFQLPTPIWLIIADRIIVFCLCFILDLNSILIVSFLCFPSNLTTSVSFACNLLSTLCSIHYI